MYVVWRQKYFESKIGGKTEGNITFTMNFWNLDVLHTYTMHALNTLITITLHTLQVFIILVLIPPSLIPNHGTLIFKVEENYLMYFLEFSTEYREGVHWNNKYDINSGCMSWQFYGDYTITILVTVVYLCITKGHCNGNN